MKICGISDIHGNLSFEIEPCDLLLICGDIVPLSIQANSKKSRYWIMNEFIPWCVKQPCEKVMFIGGNHDMYISNHKNDLRLLLKEEDKIDYLCNSLGTYKDVTVFGTPWCKPFYDWWFMKPCEEIWNDFEKDIDNISKANIIISHDAPYGCSDVILDKTCKWWTPENIGNTAITKLVETVKPKLLLHGHLHTTNHEKEMLGDTEVYNVSLVNESYKMEFKPLYLDFNIN